MSAPMTGVPRGRTRAARPTSDVAVIGAGLGGLSAAIHLRLAGHRVTVFEANARVGGRANLILKDGFQFDTGPSLLNYPWVFEDLFRAAGSDLHREVRLLPVEPSVGFRWRDGAELLLSSDRERLALQFERLHPGSAAGLDAYWRDAAEKYRLAFDKLACRNEDNPVRWLGALTWRELLRTGVWRSLDAELGRFFRSRHIREALGSYGMYLGGSPFELPGLFSILPYGEMAYGLWLPEGGIYALVAAIERLARGIGVAVHTGARVRRIHQRNGRAVGVELSDGTLQAASTVVSNVDVPTTQESLLQRTPDRVTMTPGVITFYWGVRGKPANLGHHTIFLPGDYRGAFAELSSRGRIPRDLPFYVAMASETDPQLAPPGDATVFVLVPTPVLSRLGRVDWEETVGLVRRQVLLRLQEHGVDLTPARIVSETCYTPEDWRAQFGLFDGSAFGAAHTLRQMGPFRSPNRSRSIEGLYYVGASTTPGTGMPMVVLGGKMTAERIGARVR